MNNNEYRKFIIRITRGAGKIIRAKFQKIKYVKFKDKWGDPVTEADLASEDYIISQIKREFPRHGILSEEKGVDGYNHSDYLWIIDPLDGTSNFLIGIPMFCVSVALARKGKIILGAIYAPIHNEMFFGEHGRGAFLNKKRIRISGLANQRMSRIMMAWATPQQILDNGGGLLKTIFVNGAR